MKRAISFILVAVLFLCVPVGVLAAEYDENDTSADTYVYYTIEEEVNDPSYIISIPASVEFGENRTAVTEVVAEDVTDLGDQRITVRVANCSTGNTTFKMVSEDTSQTISFTITGTQKVVTVINNDKSLNEIATFTEDGSQELIFSQSVYATNGDPGFYSCTMTFSIGLVDINS